jgi:hypothetical protein
MIHEATLLLGTGQYKWSLNTFNPSTGALITLAGSPSLMCRINGGATTTDASLTIDNDFNDGGGAHTGEHQCVFDVDDATLALADGDSVEVLLAAGTVNSVDVTNTVIARFEVTNGALPTQTKADINAEADTALDDFFANLDEAALQQIVDDLENGGRLDLLIDAIKAKTDPLTFTQTGHVDANVQRINDITITGDGSGSPFSV